jgi:ectoine hydroxylase-related dioxygenase (phytanoyl-CoA dioxygenase family)
MFGFVSQTVTSRRKLVYLHIGNMLFLASHAGFPSATDVKDTSSSEKWKIPYIEFCGLTKQQPTSENPPSTAKAGANMTPQQLSSFHEHGYLLLRGAIPKKQLSKVRDDIFEQLKRLNMWSSGKRLSALNKNLTPFQETVKISSSIKDEHLHKKLLPDQITSLLPKLAGQELVFAHQQLLISLPNQGTWSLAGLNWHTDVAPSFSDLIPGIQAFILIDKVKSHGGGTLALAGSHLFNRRNNLRGKACEILRAGGDVTYLAPNMSIVEMAGEAGDVYLMDMRVLHTPSINATHNVRIMATVRYLANELRM